MYANTVYTGDPVYSRHFVASRINAPAAAVAVVFTLDHIVTTQTTMGWTKSLQYPGCELDSMTNGATLTPAERRDGIESPDKLSGTPAARLAVGEAAAVAATAPTHRPLGDWTLAAIPPRIRTTRYLVRAGPQLRF